MFTQPRIIHQKNPASVETFNYQWFNKNSRFLAIHQMGERANQDQKHHKVIDFYGFYPCLPIALMNKAGSIL